MGIGMQGLSYARNGEWLELSPDELLAFVQSEANQPISPIEAGSHPHHVRQWLLALGLFPEKWINRLFSVGGIRMDEGRIQLRTFLPGDAERNALYRIVSQSELYVEGGSKAEVLYQDDWCLVMNKPAGMSVHPAQPGERGTLDESAIRAVLRTGDRQSANHIHRLDDDTAGPVLYAKNELAQLRLDHDMREKAISRQYAAVVHGALQHQNGTIDAPIGKDRHHRSRRMVSASGDHAVTHYETVAVYNTASLVRVWLETGRTHQIRVHMSHLGHPLVGDKLYGGRDSRLRHQALRGEQLVFKHPWSGQAMSVVAPEPDWFREVRERYATL